MRILSAALAALVLLASGSTMAQKDKDKKKFTDALIVAKLRQAFKSIDRGDPIYKGFRGSAHNKINLAISARRRR